MAKLSRSVTVRINGKEATGSIRSLIKERGQLVRAIEKGTLSEKEYIAAFKRLDEINPLITKHRRRLRGIESSHAKLTESARGFLGVAGIAFGADLIVDYGKQLFKTGIEMDTLGRKANTVLGPSLGLVSSEAEHNAAAMGLTNAQYTAAVTNIADFLKPMGFSTRAAADQAIEMQNLAGALSEWSGGQFSATEVSASFRKALVGEREELERYGISIKQSDLNTRLAALGLKGLTGQAKKQAEAMATLQLITEQSTDAQIAYNENTDSAVRRQAELSAKISDISERMATLLLPVFERIVDVVGSVSSGILELIGTFEGITDPATAVTKALAAQQSTVEGLEKELPKLLERYEQIKDSKIEEEQKELAEVIQRIGELTPSAIEQIDKYGRVIRINAEESRAFLEAERKRLEFVNGEAITTLEKETQKIKENIAVRQKQIELGGKLRQTREGGKLVEDSPEQILDVIKEVEKLQRKLEGAELQLNRLQGIAPESPAAKGQEEGPTEEEIKAQELRAKALAEQRSKQAKKEAAALEKRRGKLLEIVKKFREEERLAELSAEERKIAGLEAKFQKQIDKAIKLENKKVEGATAARLELERQKQKAVDELRTELLKESFEKEQAIQDELNQQQNIRSLERKLAKQEADRQIATELRALTLSEQELILLDLEAHFQQLKFLAEKHGIDTLDIEIVQARERQKILDKFQKKDQEKFIASQKAKAQALADAFGAMSTAITGALDVATAAGIENTSIGKLLAVAQIGLSSAEAIAKATASAAGIPFPGNLVAIATAVGTVLSNIGRAKQALDGVKVPQKMKGGFTTVTGADDGLSYRAKYIGEPQTGMLDHDHPVLFSSASGGPVLANEQGREFLISNQSLKNPVVANYARIIDNIQRGRTQQRAEGGFTNPSTSSTPAAGPSPGISAESLGPLLGVIERLNSILENGIFATVDDEQVVEIWKRQRELEMVSGGTLGIV